MKKTNGQSGFTMIELTMVLLVIGLMIGGALWMLKPIIVQARVDTTRQKLDNISDALAMFAQTYGHLPCPAVPNPTGWGAVFGDPIYGNDDRCAVALGMAGFYPIWGPATQVGIVPFHALGLTEENVRDAYGNLITYAVNAEMAIPYDSSMYAQVPVQQSCRSPLWFDKVTGKNKNPAKAMLCCPLYNPTTELHVLEQRGSTNQLFPIAPNSLLYATPNVPYDGVTPAPDYTTSMLAFILVSHGENGDGAFVKNSGVQRPRTAEASAQEALNEDGDTTFISATYSTAQDANYFDDIVLWRTNDQVVSNFGNNSCSKP